VLEIVAYILNDDSRYFKSLYAADPNFVRAQVLETPNAHHTITFIRYKATGISDRTFLNAIVAKKVAENPLTYAVALVPIPSHAKIGSKDEKGAVRAELYRSFRLSEVVPGVTKLEYVTALNLKGGIPQIVTQTIAVPEQRVSPSTVYTLTLL
jgi:hypothetical protein